MDAGAKTAAADVDEVMARTQTTRYEKIEFLTAGFIRIYIAVVAMIEQFHTCRA